MPSAEATLPGAVSSVPPARHFVESVLTAWGAAGTAWTATLVVSELVTNSVLHARTEFRLRVSLDAEQTVRLEVSDTSLRLPQPRSYGVGATTGRGLRLVAELSDDWGVDRRADGKTVWVLLSASGGPGDDVDALLQAFGDDLDPSGAASG